MTAAIPEGLEPVGVWDAGPGWVDDLVNERIAWARQHIERVNDTWRVEFYADPPRAIVHRFKVNAEGRKYAIGHQSFITNGEPAREEPVIVPLAALPPARLLGPGPGNLVALTKQAGREGPGP